MDHKEGIAKAAASGRCLARDGGKTCARRLKIVNRKENDGYGGKVIKTRAVCGKHKERIYTPTKDDA